jgi:hypothetical protein
MDKTLGIGINMTVELIKTIGAVCASLMAIATLCGGIWWLVRRVVKITDAVQQLRPNGGSSIADKVNKISTNMDDMKKNIETLAGEVEKLKVFDEGVVEAVAKALKDDKRKGKRW